MSSNRLTTAGILKRAAGVARPTGATMFKDLPTAEEIREKVAQAEVSREDAVRSGLLQKIPVGMIEPDPGQPRKRFNEATVNSLAENMRAVGQLQPISVRPSPDYPGRFIIIYGERRWRALQKAGIAEAEAVIREETNLATIRLIQLSENSDSTREGVSPFEEGIAMVNLIRQIEAGENVSLDDPESVLTKRLRHDPVWVHKRLMLGQMPPPVHALWEDGILADMETALALMRIYREDEKRALQIIEEARKRRALPRSAVTGEARRGKSTGSETVVRGRVPMEVRELAGQIRTICSERLDERMQLVELRKWGEAGNGYRISLEVKDAAELERLKRLLAKA